MPRAKVTQLLKKFEKAILGNKKGEKNVANAN